MPDKYANPKMTIERKGTAREVVLQCAGFTHRFSLERGELVRERRFNNKGVEQSIIYHQGQNK